MKVLLALPRFEPNASPPLGLAYLAACLRDEGIDVSILDPTFVGWDYAANSIKWGGFDIIGFSCFTMNYNASKRLAGIAKEANNRVVTVFGGVHPTILPKETIRDKEVDIVCIGEAEGTFVQLVKALSANRSLKGIPGIWFKQGKRIVKNKPAEPICNLDHIPFPARDLLPMDRYLNANLGTSAWAVRQPSTTVIVGRGCPFNCTYCSTKLLTGKTVRFRSPQNVINEIESLIREYGIKGVSFIDDTFTMSKEVVEGICDKLIESGLGIDWACHTHVNTISPELLKKMKKAGCTFISLGVESGNQYILDNFVKKGIRLEKVKEVFKWAKQSRITTGAYFLLGIPGETKLNMQETIDFAKSLNLDVVNFNVVRPLPKTEMYKLAEVFGKLKVESWDDFDFDAKPIFESDMWSGEYVEEMCRKAYKEFYFRPSFIIKQLLSIRSRQDLRKIYNGFLMISQRVGK